MALSVKGRNYFWYCQFSYRPVNQNGHICHIYSAENRCYITKLVSYGVDIFKLKLNFKQCLTSCVCIMYLHQKLKNEEVKMRGNGLAMKITTHNKVVVIGPASWNSRTKPRNEIKW